MEKSRALVETVARIDPKVIVFCMSYNHAMTIRDAIDSFLMQKTNFTYCVVVHDDCSVDGTQNILKEYQKKFPNLVLPYLEDENTYSKGTTVFNELMVEVSQGRYMASCDGDDYWLSTDKLQIQYDALEKNLNCGACVHKTSSVKWNGESKGIFFPNFPLEEGIVYKKQAVKYIVSEGYPFHTSSYMFRGEVFRLPLETFRTLSRLDVGQMLCAALYGDIYYCDETMSVVREGNETSFGSIYNNSDAEKKSQMMWKYIEVFSHFNDLTNHEYDEICLNRIRLLLYEYYLVKRNAKEYRYIYSNIGVKRLFANAAIAKRIKDRLLYTFPQLLLLRAMAEKYIAKLR